MHQPSTSRIHSVLLVAAGAVAGSLGTLALQYATGGFDGSSPEQAAVSPAPGSNPAATSRRADHGVRLEQILAADDREHKTTDLRRLGSDAALQDEAAALRLVAGIRSQSDRADFMKGIVEGMAERNPRAAAEFSLANLSKGALQAEALRLSLGKWGSAAPRDAYAWAAEKLNGPVKEEAINALVSNWAAKSPEAAARWFEETGSTSQPLLASLISGWASTPETARAAAGWVETLPEGDIRTAGRVLAAAEWARQEPAAAAANYPNPAPELASVLADIWGTSQPAEAARWIQQLPPGAAREEAAGTLATVWAASDITAAAAWSASLSDAAVRGAAVEHVATTWGAIDPDKAIGWLASQPADMQPRGYTGAYNSWAGTDPAGLSDWITQLPANSEADIARRSLAEVRLPADPASAMDLALGMTAASQPDAAGRYFRQWRRTDDGAAQEWLQQHWTSLTPEAQSRLAKEQAR